MNLVPFYFLSLSENQKSYISDYQYIIILDMYH